MSPIRLELSSSKVSPFHYEMCHGCKITVVVEGGLIHEHSVLMIPCACDNRLLSLLPAVVVILVVAEVVIGVLLAVVVVVVVVDGGLVVVEVVDEGLVVVVGTVVESSTARFFAEPVV